MIYAFVENGHVLSIGLPQVGVLKNGCSVSGYDLLSDAILREEGWMPIQEELITVPEEYVKTFEEYRIVEDIVVPVYRVEKPSQQAGM